MAQNGIVELERMIEFVQRFAVALNVHQNVMGLVDFLDRVSQLTATPVFQTMKSTALGSNDGAVALDHAGHLLALVRMDDKNDFVMTHANSFWDKPSTMRMR